MRVLMTTDSVGGVWTYSLELVEGLAGLGVDVTLAAMGPPAGRSQRLQLRETPVAAYAERSFALEWMDDPWSDLERARSWLLELASDARADVIHLNGYVQATAGFDVPVLVVGHSCVVSWHEAVRLVPAGAEWARYRSEVRRGIRAANALVAPTRAHLAELERHYRPTCLRLTIYNGRAPGNFRPLPKRAFVLGVGRAWDDAKNLGALERIADGLPWPVITAGDGEQLGRVGEHELALLDGEAAIFAEPARYEPFGLAALEAGLCSCALVLGAIPSLREVWGDAAVYVDPFDDDSLRRAIEQLIADNDLRTRLGAAARRRALGYSRERMAAAYLRLYEHLATQSGAHGILAMEASG
jgi:glycosyltransferase involved in cell wall biosynthesis